MPNFFDDDDQEGFSGSTAANTVGHILRDIASTGGIQLYRSVHCSECGYDGNHLISRRHPEIGMTCPSCRHTLTIEGGNNT